MAEWAKIGLSGEHTGHHCTLQLVGRLSAAKRVSEVKQVSELNCARIDTLASAIINHSQQVCLPALCAASK